MVDFRVWPYFLVDLNNGKFEIFKIETVEGVEKSVIAKHEWENHEGKPIGVKMKIVKSYRGDPTARQAAEGVMIRKTPEDLLMNSKSEFVQPCTVKEKFESQSGSWKDKQREKLTNIQKNALHKKLRERFGIISKNTNDTTLKKDGNIDEKKTENFKLAGKRKKEDKNNILQLIFNNDTNTNRVKSPNISSEEATSSNALINKDIIDSNSNGSQEFLQKQSQELARFQQFSFNFGGKNATDSDLKISNLSLLKSTKKYGLTQKSKISYKNVPSKKYKNVQTSSRKTSQDATNSFKSQDIRTFFDRKDPRTESVLDFYSTLYA